MAHRRFTRAGWLAVALMTAWATSGSAIDKAPSSSPSTELHWSFIPVQRPQTPTVGNVDWPAGDIDRLILSQLEDADLAPTADADKRTLIRRAYFVLTGLPPTPQQIDTFLTDDAPDAFERLVDRLLASPHFGEHWGRHWLDVARFSQSTGGGRSLLYGTAWRYRDYVIGAFNEDKPFDEFINEQLAGDLLPHQSVKQQRNQLIATAFLALGPTNYELQDKEQLRMDVIDEQIDTMGRAFLGMTLGCARCHDHKFDPVPTKDYYALAGIFRSTHTLIHDNVSTWVKRPLPRDKTQLAAEAMEAQDALKALQSRLTSLQSVRSQLRDELGITGKTVSLDDEQKGVQFQGNWQQSSSVQPFVGKAYRYASGNGAKATYRVPIAEPGTYDVYVSYAPHPNRASNSLIQIEHKDGRSDIRVNQKKLNKPDRTFQSIGVFSFDREAVVTISTEDAKGTVIADAVKLLPLADGQSEQLRQLELKVEKLSQQINQHNKSTSSSAPMVMAVAEEPQPVDYHICVRGNVHELGEIAPRGFLSAADAGHAVDISAGASGRRELAAWIASSENPLTARVAANRLWHHLFGSGLVRTVDNLGTTGERPSHPALLDYLASRLVDHGWRFKPMIREILLSRTWQLSSESTPELTAADPENRLFGRQNLHRLTAEELYDSILSLAGTLDKTIGGQTVREGTKSEYGYRFDVGRRGIYLPVFRNRTHELFAVFDFPDPNLSVGRRNVSTLPTQALFLMNSPFILQQAEHAAKKILAQPINTTTERLNLLYKSAVGRTPTNGEAQLAVAFLSDTGQANDPQRLTTWTQLCQVVIGCVDFRYVR